MAAAGVCHSDLHVVDGEWERPAGRRHGPRGRRVGRGDSVRASRDLEVGDLVVLAWTAPCGRCEACARDEPWLCTRPGWQRASARPRAGEAAPPERRRPVGAYSGIGTFGERQVVAASAAIRVDPRTPPEIAALIGCAVTTGIGAVRNTAKRAGGGVGGRDRCRRRRPERRHRSRRAKARNPVTAIDSVAGEARAGHTGRRPPRAARERGRSGPRGRSRARVHRPGRDGRARDRSRASRVARSRSSA